MTEFEEYLRGTFEINNGVENDVDNLVRIHAPELLKLAKKELMKEAVEAVVSQVPCANEIIFRNPASVSYWYLPSEMNRLGINKGDKVKVIIIKE